MIRNRLLFGTAIVLSQACGDKQGSDCPLDMTCSQTTATARLTSGELTVTAGDGDPETFRAGAECTASFKTAILPGESSYAPPLPFVVCRSGDREISMTASLLHDLRPLKQDKTTYKPEWNEGRSMVAVDVKTSRQCSYFLSQGTLVFDVTEVQGQDLPASPYATSDYLRRVAVHVEASGADAVCGPVSIVADVTVEQTASDIVTRQVRCYCL
jgi:hypothetical protein